MVPVSVSVMPSLMNYLHASSLLQPIKVPCDDSLLWPDFRRTGALSRQCEYKVCFIFFGAHIHDLGDAACREVVPSHPQPSVSPIEKCFVFSDLRIFCALMRTGTILTAFQLLGTFAEHARCEVIILITAGLMTYILIFFYGVPCLVGQLSSFSFSNRKGLHMEAKGLPKV